MEKIVGADLAARLRDAALAVYGRGRELAGERGIIIADTKMEFGLFEGRLILIDELLTPDSSRFWSARELRSRGAARTAGTSRSCATTC